MTDRSERVWTCAVCGPVNPQTHEQRHIQLTVLAFPKREDGADQRSTATR
jgi:hypothetical protein